MIPICTVGLVTPLLEMAERAFEPDTAGAFVNQYRQIKVPKFELRGNEVFVAGELTVAATAYVNTNNKAARTDPQVVTAGKRSSMRSMLLGLRDSKPLKEFVTFTDTGSGYSVTSGGRTLFSYTAYGVKQSFMGKGTPVQVGMAATLMNLWRLLVLDIQGRDRSGSRTVKDKLTAKAAKKANSATTTYSHRFVARDLGIMVSEYLGMDCNGFVNLYLKSKYPDLKIKSAHTMEDSYVEHCGFRHDNKRIASNTRQTIDDIQADDAVVFFTGNYHHIAVVNTVFARNSDHVVVSLAESRGTSFGGVQTNTWTIRNKTDTKKAVIEGKFLIDGRREDYVKIVSPQRWNVS